MINAGERSVLLNELRQLGPVCWSAAHRLGISVFLVQSLPVGAVFAADIPAGVLICLATEPEWSAWAGIAHFLAHDLGINPERGLIYDCAAMMSQRSGILFSKKTG